MSRSLAMLPPRFALDVRGPTRAVTRVVPRGELDLATAPELEGWLDDLRRERADVVVELAEITFIDSAGIRVLLRAREQARRSRTGLRFESGGPEVMRTLQLTGVVGALGFG
ncbi:MAG: STAS domain-containing protein [Solirubrobacterales bacterium]|nr:STAS domain-containing protein [Solirubrobacterales bacterium]